MLTITYEPTEATETHRHNFSYNAVGNTLTATCAHDDGKECNLESSSYQISTSLIPPQNLIFTDGWNYPASMSGFENFRSETKATIGPITYIKTDTNEDYGTSKPNATGTYTASVTINADNYPYTLQTSYRVTDYHFVYNNYPQFTITTDKSGNYAGNGQTVTITFTPKFGETLTGTASAAALPTTAATHTHSPCPERMSPSALRSPSARMTSQRLALTSTLSRPPTAGAGSALPQTTTWLPTASAARP